MKAPVGLLSDRTVLRSKMEGLRPDKFQFVDLKQNTVPYIAVMRFGAWLLIFLRKEQYQMKLVLAEKLSFLPYSFSRSPVRLAISSSRSSSSGSVHLTAFAE